MYDALKADYGNTVPDEWLHFLLDTYEKDPEYIERLCKDLKNEHKAKGLGKSLPPPKTRLTAEELEQLNEKAKEVQEFVLQNNKCYIVKKTEEEEQNELDKADIKELECGEAPLLEQ